MLVTEKAHERWASMELQHEGERMVCLGRIFTVGLATLLLSMAGCSRPALTREEVSRLDSLDATGVVEAYFSLGDPQVELHLSSPEERSARSAANYIAEDERVGGIEDLRISGGLPAGRTIAGAAEFVDIRQFIVEYMSKRSSSTGEPPGRRHLFVYTGQEAKTGCIRVLSVGTGP